MGGVDDRDRRSREAREIRRPADLGQGLVVLEIGLQGDGIGDLPALDELENRPEDAPVHRLEEMLGQQEIGDPVDRCVVDEKGGEQGLLGLDVVGQALEGFRLVAAPGKGAHVGSGRFHLRRS